MTLSAQTGGGGEGGGGGGRGGGGGGGEQATQFVYVPSLQTIYLLQLISTIQ